jgi:hypothetical protein
MKKLGRKGNVYIFCALSVHHEQLGAVEVGFGFAAAFCSAEVFFFDAATAQTKSRR